MESYRIKEQTEEYHCISLIDMLANKTPCQWHILTQNNYSDSQTPVTANR